MNDCINAEIRDALPDLLHSNLGTIDRATFTAHVESCADCRAELALLAEVKASAPLAPKLHVGRIVAALPHPIPSAFDSVVSIGARSKARPRSFGVWKMAAAATLLITGSLTFANARRQSNSPASPVAHAAVASAVVPQTATESVQPITVAAGVAAIAEPAPASRPVASRQVTALSLTGGVQDLTDAQLQSLLKGLDQVDGLPAAEPEPVTVRVDENEGLQ